jgi:hypothetical protein
MMRAYVYAVIVDGVIRYVGKGSGARVRAHMRIARSIARRRAAGEAVRASHFYNRLTQAWLAGAEIREMIIASGLTDTQAYDREIGEIAARRKELWNFWGGGEGSSKGYKKSAEQRWKIAESNRKTWSDPQLLAEHSARCKIVLLKPEVRAKLRRPKTEAEKLGIRERAKMRWADPAFREKMRNIFDNPTFKRRRSEATKTGWQTRRMAK